MSSTRRKETQSGSALVEFALAATMLVMLAVGSISFGLAVQTGIIVADAANAGALAGANSTYWATDTNDVHTVTVEAGLNTQNFTSTVSYFCACTAGGAVVDCTSACGSDQPLYYVKVTASSTLNNFFHYAGLPSTFSLQGATIMPVQ